MSPTHQDDASMGGASLARSVTPFQIQDEDEPEVDAQLNSIRPTIPLHSISSPFQDFSIGRRRWEFNKHWRRIRQGVCRVTVPREDENEIYDLRVPVKSIVDGTPIEVARSPFAEALGSPGRFGKPDVGARNISPSRPLTIRDPYSPVPLVPASFLAAPALAHVSVPVPVPAPGSIPAPVSFPAPAPTPVSFKYIIIIKDFTKYNIIFSQPGLTRIYHQSNTSGPPDRPPHNWGLPDRTPPLVPLTFNSLHRNPPIHILRRLPHMLMMLRDPSGICSNLRMLFRIPV